MFSTDTFQILSRELPEQSGREERARVLEEMWRAGNKELITGTGLLSFKKTRPFLPIFCRLKCHNVMGHILDLSWWLAEGSERFTERVVIRCVQRESAAAATSQTTRHTN